MFNKELYIQVYLVNILLYFFMFSYRTRANSTRNITHY